MLGMMLIALQRLANHRNFHDLLNSFDPLLYLSAIMADAVLVDDLLVLRHRRIDNVLNLTAADAMLVDDLRHVPNLNLRRFD